MSTPPPTAGLDRKAESKQYLIVEESLNHSFISSSDILPCSPPYSPSCQPATTTEQPMTMFWDPTTYPANIKIQPKQQQQHTKLQHNSNQHQQFQQDQQTRPQPIPQPQHRPQQQQKQIQPLFYQQQLRLQSQQQSTSTILRQRLLQEGGVKTEYENNNNISQQFKV